MQRPRTGTNRRSFLMHSAAAVAATSTLEIGRSAYAAGTDEIKVGLIGCGGRGTGAAEQALTADPNTKLVAVGDAFKDRMDDCLAGLKGSGVGERVDVADDHRFVGFDAYKNVIDTCDLVILASPPGFRPLHFTYAVEKGKHAFVEKPMAVDGPGLRMFLDAARKSKEKGLSAVNGFCWRYHQPRRETMQQVFDGAIGDIVAVETVYNSQGVWEPRKTREECGSDMEYQMRNWYYYDWLSGDHIVEQAIHGIDTMAWALGDKPPLRCFGVGGRQVRTAERYGNIYDHFSIVYEYPNEVRGYHQCRHWPSAENRVKDYILGSKGTCDVFGNRLIGGENPWRYKGKNTDMYQAEHNEMFAAIRAGKPINNVEQAASSTLLGLMGRMAAYTGDVITWDMAMNSQEALVPTEFTWGDAPQRPVPIPGAKKFV